jgi:hypothetical protein
MKNFTRIANYISLLNYTELTEEYGPPRLYWEGPREKFIQNLKPFLSGVRNNSGFFQTKLLRVYQKEALLQLMVGTEEDTNNTGTHRQRYTFARTYKSLAFLKSHINRQYTFSGIIVSGSVYAIVKAKNCLNLHQIMFADADTGRFTAGLYFAHTSLALDPTTFNGIVDLKDRQTIRELADSSCVMLPFPKAADEIVIEHTPFCTAFSSNWRERVGHHNWELPQLAKAWTLCRPPQSR